MLTKYRLFSFTLLLIASIQASHAGTVYEHTITSNALKNTLLNVKPERQVYVYVPDGYTETTQTYPVIYYVTSFHQKLDNDVISALDSAIEKGDLPPTLFVSANYELEQGFNFFGNNNVVGRWLDFIHEDVRHWAEKEYRITQKPSSRAISGHFLGAYAAIKLAMLHPDTYGTVYGLHPVATESGDRPWLYKPDWKEVNNAKGFADLKSHYSAPFVSMAQAHLPNPSKPPFYADFLVEQINGELIPNVATMRKLKKTFHLADLTADNAENLLALQGIGFDWGRNDQNFGHVIGARRYSVLLENFGIPHQAQEHLGTGWDYSFAEGGRIRTLMLPFIGRYLAQDN